MFERESIRYTLKSNNKDEYNNIEKEFNNLLNNEFKIWYSRFNN